MLKRFPEGSNLTLLNTIYTYPKKNNDGKWDKDAMVVIYKDNNTGIKYHERIEKPDYEFYIAKDDVPIYNNELFIEKDKVNKISAPFTDLEKTIAEMTDNLKFYYENIKLGNRYANKKLHTNPRIFMSDSNIEDHYRFRFDNLYVNDSVPISKLYFDIEVDTINMAGDFPEPGECPVNAIAIIDEVANKTYSLVLRNPKNPLIQEFENSINDGLFSELMGLIRDTVGGWKNEIRYGLEKMQYEFLFYDEEIALIQDLFRYINSTRPDFVLAWNMAFDMNYLIERLKVLGYNPEDIICHPDFEKPVCQYRIDERNMNEMAERGDKAIISSYSVYLDQMIHFASRRKGQGVFDSVSLDYIGGIIAKVKKLDYSHITTNIAKLPYLDFKIFIFYNIIDTIVQKCIEAKVADIDYVFNKCLLNNTRYDKCHRQTVYLVNRGAKEFYQKNNCIIGNNYNKTNEKPTKKFPGAFVAAPYKLNNYAKKSINGRSVDLLDNLDDYDYKSLYPSEMREFNMAANTQIGMINIPDIVYDKENPFNSKDYTRGGAFIEDFHSGNILEFSHRWLGLASYSDLYKDVYKYFTVNTNSCFFIRNFNRETGNLIIMETIQNNKPIKIIETMQNNEKVRIIDSYSKCPNKKELLMNIPKEGIVYNEL